MIKDMSLSRNVCLAFVILLSSFGVASSAQAVSWKGFWVKKVGAHASLLTVKFEDNSKIGIAPDKLYLSGNLGKNLNLRKKSIKTRESCSGKFDPLGSCYTYTYLFNRINHGITFRGTIYYVIKGHWPHFIFHDEVSSHRFAVRL